MASIAPCTTHTELTDQSCGQTRFADLICVSAGEEIDLSDKKFDYVFDKLLLSDCDWKEVLSSERMHGNKVAIVFR